MRAWVADYEVVRAWGNPDALPARLLCRPPARIGGHDQVLVWCLDVDAEGWQQLCDLLIRFGGAGDEGLIRVLEVGPDLDSGRVFLVTEAAVGGTLASVQIGLPAKARVDAMVVVSRAAHALHEVGLAHGAVSAANVYLTNRGPALGPPALDLPEGALVLPHSETDVAVLGPDLLAGDAPTRASDIWSLGATTHRVLSDRPLYPGLGEDGPVLAAQQVLLTRPELDPSIPEPVREVIEACMSRDPGQRPVSASDVAERLRTAGAEL